MYHKIWLKSHTNVIITRNKINFEEMPHHCIGHITKNIYFIVIENGFVNKEILDIKPKIKIFEKL